MLSHVTTILEIVAVLLLVLAAAVAVAEATGFVAAGFAVGGVGLLAGSWVLERLGGS